MKLDAERDRFLEDVKEHQMTVLVDDGVLRHVRFAKPDSGDMAFSLITWPWHLCYTGDMGTYVFSRIEDMFEFFRGRGKAEDVEGFYRIDRDYWAQKLLAQDRDGVRVFSEELFREAVKERYKAFCERGHGPDSEEAKDLWDDIEGEVLCRGDNMSSAIDAAMSFRWKKQEVFPDFWEHRLETWTSRFVWCCYALRWGVHQWDTKIGEDRYKRRPIVHAVDDGAQGDLKIACTQEWTEAEWKQEGIYWAENGKRYAFDPAKITCPKCKAKEKQDGVIQPSDAGRKPGA